MVWVYLHDSMNAIKDRATDTDVMSKWPDVPQCWGCDEWNDMGRYALGHGLSLHDRPFFNQQNVHVGGETPDL